MVEARAGTGGSSKMEEEVQISTVKVVEDARGSSVRSISNAGSSSSRGKTSKQW